jgi:hypothetical protein
VFSRSSSEREVEYKLPSQVAVCQDSVIRNVIGREELDRHLSLAYLHPSLQPLPPLSLLSHLGVRHLRGSDVTTVTTAMARELTAGGELHTGASVTVAIYTIAMCTLLCTCDVLPDYCPIVW